MKVNIRDLLENAGVEEPFYPGKKLVKKYVQPGENKSHCLVFDWHNPSTIRIDLLAGLSGKPMPSADLHRYPVAFQAPTYLELETSNDNGDTEEERGSADGKSGGGGRKPSKVQEKASLPSLSVFAQKAEGFVSHLAEIKKFVVMGRELANESFAQAYENLKVQVAQTKIMTMDLMKGISNIIQKATPGGGLKAKGDETVPYRYDTEKNAAMFGGLTPS